MLRLFLIPVVLILLPAGARAQDSAVRYVVPMTSPLPSDSGGEQREFPLWTSKATLDGCKRTMLSYVEGTGATKEDVKDFCETGAASYLPPPRQGIVAVGQAVELLDAQDCGPGVRKVRILDGPLAGKTGCIKGDALSSIKPPED